MGGHWEVNDEEWSGQHPAMAESSYIDAPELQQIGQDARALF